MIQETTRLGRAARMKNQSGAVALAYALIAAAGMAAAIALVLFNHG